ncbi:hypothetical protein F4808DRAFT_109211 [Astrocystis sublimbata]|nr:hypothetical protein F4808DRAFT_109211 [Astrocystis sublimbata]
MHVVCPSVSTMRCPYARQPVHIDSLIVAMDGAFVGKGFPNGVRTAHGVFFGPNEQNRAARIPNEPSIFRAYLSVACAGLIASQQFIFDSGQWDSPVGPCPVRHIVIKSDSGYLVRGITEWVDRWRENGWRTPPPRRSKGGPTATTTYGPHCTIVFNATRRNGSHK